MSGARYKRWIGEAFWPLAALYLGGAAAQCDDSGKEEPPGAARVQWRVSPLGCEHGEVEQVRLWISGPTPQPAEGVFAPCAAQEAQIEGLEMGRYAVMVEGLDASGDVTFQSGVEGFSVSPQTVTVTPTARLSARPAALAVSWFFDNGRLCASNEVTQVVLTVYDDNAFAVQERRDPCELGQSALEALPAGDFYLEALGLDVAGVARFRDLEALTLKRGQEATAEVSLRSCDDGDC
jgi:hypothetical protein